MVVVLGERPQCHRPVGQQTKSDADKEQSDSARSGDFAADSNDESVEYPGNEDGHDHLKDPNRGVATPDRESRCCIVRTCKSIRRKQRLGTDNEGENRREVLRDCEDCGERTDQQIQRSDDGEALVTVCIECGEETGRFS